MQVVNKYKDEQASPGYYSNYLTKYNVKTEVSATPRTGIARFTFPKGKSHILLNLGEGLTNESGAMLRRVSDSEVEGVKLLGTFCYNPQAVFPIYFVLRVKKNPSATGYWKKQRNWRKTRCPHCKKHKLQRLSSKVIDRSNGTKTEEVVYKCRNCGHILRRKERSRDENYNRTKG